MGMVSAWQFRHMAGSSDSDTVHFDGWDSEISSKKKPLSQADFKGAL